MSKAQQVQRTKDYDKFQVFKFNRGINESLVKKLMESIEEIGYVEAKPVLVDETFAIIDGQHRFTACQRMGIDVLYMVTDVDPEKAIVNLNATQAHWKMIDYINLYAQQGVKCYQHLLDFEGRRKLGISNSMYVLFVCGGVDSADVKKVKAGHKFSINNNAEKIAQFISTCDVPYAKSSYFIKAVVRVFKMADEKQLEKIKNGIIATPQQANTAAYMAVFENIVNKGLSAKNRVSFRIN